MREKLNFALGLIATIIVALTVLLSVLLPDPPPADPDPCPIAHPDPARHCRATSQPG